MEKHTPAPWRFIPSVGYVMGADGESPFGPREVQVGIVGNYGDTELLPFNRERWNADGRLIAAAPRMLKALEEAKYFFDEDFPDGPDGPCAVTERYREAYRLICAALAAAHD